MIRILVCLTAIIIMGVTSVAPADDPFANLPVGQDPFASEFAETETPPILYPDEQREHDLWSQLESETGTYGDRDTSLYSEQERKILEALDNDARIDATSLPLADVVDNWRSEHGIDIGFDIPELRRLEMDPELLLIDRDISGISFRSCLKLILEDVDLTYTIRNEVLLITSEEKAEEYLQRKVHPVVFSQPATPMQDRIGRRTRRRRMPRMRYSNR
jgi:hypothetical protein